MYVSYHLLCAIYAESSFILHLFACALLGPPHVRQNACQVCNPLLSFRHGYTYVVLEDAVIIQNNAQIS